MEFFAMHIMFSCSDLTYFIKTIEQLFSQQMIQPLTEPTLTYRASPEEGECLLVEVHPLLKSNSRSVLAIILSFLTGGLFALLLYWYPRLERWVCYSYCSAEQATHYLILNYDQQYCIVEKQEEIYCPTGQESQRVQGFTNRYMRYISLENTIMSATFNFRPHLQKVMKSPLKGLTQLEAQKLRKSFGPGTMIIDRPNILVLFGREVFRPLYLFILFSVILWTYEAYYYYAGVIFVTSAVSIGINLYQVRQLNEKIFHMAYYDIPLNVLRQGQVLQISSVDVVPGDIVFLKDPIKLPFQGVILEGSALINECALTGQSVPVVKKADFLEKYEKEGGQIDKNAFVFEGTTIIQVNMRKKMHKFEIFRESYGIPACVVRTNFSTLKGQLIRIISFPKEQENQFQQQSSRFLIFLFLLAICSYSFLIIKLHTIVQAADIVVKFLDLITITVPPGLPVSMTFGIIFALEKLKAKQIFCISPNKIIYGGRVNHACFDKTGTLTEDFMDFYGLIPCFKAKFSSFIAAPDQKKDSYQLTVESLLETRPEIARALDNMASNHSIVQIQETGQLVGDPMEIKLFEFGEFSLDLSHHNPDIIFSYSSKRGDKGNVLRRFQFDSELQRMSVISSKGNNKENWVFCKGSPEVMLQIINPDSLPSDYESVLKEYASHGFRVLAIACKKLQGDPRIILRKEAENQLQFDGFEVFENKLKKQTFGAIQELKEAEVSCVMITGDNALTGSNIAYKCEIADLDSRMFICDLRGQELVAEQFFYHQAESNSRERKKYWKKQQQNQQEIELSQELEREHIELALIQDINKSEKANKTLKNQQIIQRGLGKNHKSDEKAELFLKEMLAKCQKEKIQLCLTGNALNRLFPKDCAPEDQIRSSFLTYVKVFARTKPNDKARVVGMYQQQGKVVVMCGDGANDCGALKQADVGLSLSQAEASISAPFTSKQINISAVVKLLKECRAGLATNFSLFNIMALYSLIQYTSTIITQLYYAYPSDFQYLYWDLAGNFFFFLTFGYTGTVQVLSRHRPHNTLFSLTNVFQVLIMFVIQLVGQISIIAALQGAFSQSIDYQANGGQDINKAKYEAQQDFILDTPQTNALFLFTNFMYIFSLLGFSISKPWRKEFWTNLPFMIILVVVFLYSCLIVVVPSLRLSLFQISWMNSNSLNWFILGMGLAFGLFIYCLQKFVLEPLSQWLKEKYPQRNFL